MIKKLCMCLCILGLTAHTSQAKGHDYKYDNTYTNAYDCDEPCDCCCQESCNCCCDQSYDDDYDEPEYCTCEKQCAGRCHCTAPKINDCSCDCGYSRTCDCFKTDNCCFKDDCCDNDNITCSNWQLIIKQGYFHPKDKNLRCMFKNGCNGSGGGYFLEGAARCRLICGLMFEVNGSWFRHKGCSLTCVKSVTTVNPLTTVTAPKATCISGDPFCFKMPTFGLGLKYFYDICDNYLNIFAGAGGKVFFLETTSCYPGCCGCEKTYAAGGFVGAGLQYLPYCGFTLEAYVDYMFKTLAKSACSPCCDYSSCLDLGGLVAGIGIGYSF